MTLSVSQNLAVGMKKANFKIIKLVVPNIMHHHAKSKGVVRTSSTNIQSLWKNSREFPTLFKHQLLMNYKIWILFHN